MPRVAAVAFPVFEVELATIQMISWGCTAKDAEIEIHGDHVTKIAAELQKDRVK